MRKDESPDTDEELFEAKKYKPLGRSQIVTVTVVMFMVFPSVLAGSPLHMARS